MTEIKDEFYENTGFDSMIVNKPVPNNPGSPASNEQTVPIKASQAQNNVQHGHQEKSLGVKIGDLNPTFINSDDEDRAAPPRRIQPQESAVIGGFNDHGGEFGKKSNAGQVAPLQINKEQANPYAGSPDGNPGANYPQKSDSGGRTVNSDDIKMWQSYQQSNRSTNPMPQQQRPDHQSSMGQPVPQQPYGSQYMNWSNPPQQNNTPYGFSPQQPPAMNFGNGEGNVFNVLSPEYHQSTQGSRHFNFQPQPCYGGPEMSQAREDRANSLFGALAGAGTFTQTGQAVQNEASQNQYGYQQGGPNYQGYSQQPSLFDQFRRDQAMHNGDPFFYRQLSPAQRSPPVQSPQRPKINDSILHNFFDRYSVSGYIFPEKFMKLIEEVFTFNHQPLPNYMQCLTLMSEHDTNHDGRIDFDEFKVMMNRL